MNTVSIALTIALPSLMVLVGILINRNDATRLDARLTSMESGLRSEISASRTQFHNDVLMLLGSDKQQDTRITRLEERSH